jgi:outer membrane protein assembly factor BamB
MKKFISLCLLAFYVLLQTTFLQAQQSTKPTWNQFRGFYKNGTVSENVLLEKWPADGLKLVWKKQLGSAFSEIIVSDNMVYTMFSEKSDSISGLEFIGCFDGKTGNEIWRTEVDSIFIDVDGWGDGPHSTPAVDENHAYGFSAHGILTAVNKKSGKIVWQVDFVKEFGSVLPRWGFSTSPLLVEDILVMEAGGKENSTFVAFNKKDGKVLWAKGRGNSLYNSPSLATIGEVTQILFANGSTLYSFNTKGDTLWTINTSIRNATAMPLFFDGNKILLSNVHSRGFAVVEVNDNVAKVTTSGNGLKNDFSSSVYHDGYFYGFDVAALVCISAKTGEKKWTKRGFGKGSLILVDDKLIVLSDKGALVQVKATPEAYTEQGQMQAIEGKSWTAPSYNNGKIYVRNLTEMACFSAN